MSIPTESLPVPLTDDEIRFRGVEVAHLLAAISKLENKAKRKAQAYKQRIDETKKQLAQLADQINSRQEYREIQVEEQKDYTRKIVETLRLDTYAVIRTRPMNANELNRPLPMFGKDEPPPEAQTDDYAIVGKARRRGRKAASATA